MPWDDNLSLDQSIDLEPWDAWWDGRKKCFHCQAPEHETMVCPYQPQMEELTPVDECGMSDRYLDDLGDC